MSEMIFAAKQGRNIPKEDKIFGINNRAKAMIAERGNDAVANATIGALLDDEGKLMVLTSVIDALKELEPKDFAEYAPISGIPGYRDAVKKDILGSYNLKGYAEVVATPGGTGSIRNTMANFSERGDKVLVADWFWSPYRIIAQEIGRDVTTFTFFDENRNFNAGDLEKQIKTLLETQDRLVLILNTPAHNPTGYSLTKEDWYAVKSVLEGTPKDKKIALLVDIAYIDFAGDEEESRKFIPILEEMPENVLPIIGYSMSKAYTIYGMRGGAMMCIAKTQELAQEFKSVCEFSSRGSWSNCNRSPQVILSKIYQEPALKAKVVAERKAFRDMLLKRGKAFEAAAKEIGLEMVPFDAGFFTSLPCGNPDAVSAELEKEGIFLVPLAKGVRVSIASVSEEKCKLLPARIKAVMDRIK